MTFFKNYYRKFSKLLKINISYKYKYIYIYICLNEYKILS